MKASSIVTAKVAGSQGVLNLETVWLYPNGLSAAPLMAGVDEVGRGALFGPVVAAAVILPEAAIAPLLAMGMTDSKQLKPVERHQLAHRIRTLALAYQLGIASVWEIDRLNILQASLLAMRRAVSRLQPLPTHCLVDGNQPIPALAIPQQTVVKGDLLVPQIAAASILAKVWRDDLISRLAKRYPGYDLDQNKGYGTPRHRRALLEHGPTFFHRRSFNLGIPHRDAS